MKTFRTAAVIATFSACLLSAPVQAASNDSDGLYQPVEAPSAFSMIADLAIARPLLIATTVVGAGLFVVSLPFTVPTGAVKKTGKALVAEPGRAALARCLGCTETGRYRENNQ